MSKQEIKSVVAEIYAERKARRAHPQGQTDRGGRWYPSEIEDCGGDGTRVRSPSRAWPWSYMLRCRTRQHCAALVAAALAGAEVPPDVAFAVQSLRA